MITQRENTLRAVRFETPDYIPMRYSINTACWHHYPQEALKELMGTHPLLFPNYEYSPDPVQPELSPWQVAGQPFADSWGCVWETADDGITGAVTRHPLDNWDALASYRAPDPNSDYGWGAIDWDAERERLRTAASQGRLASGGLRHGHTFLTLTYIRGYENLMYDMADDDPRLWRLIEMVEAFNQALVDKYVVLGAEWMSYPEDLGMQVGPMLTPAQFRKYIKPTYTRLMAPARAAGCAIHMHSDGDIRALVDDLFEGGVEVFNLQDLVNGLDWIEANLAGRACIDLDIDRQRVTRYGTPTDIDALIRDEVTRLASPKGGLMMTFGLYPGTPLENAAAVMDAMERYATLYA